MYISPGIFTQTLDELVQLSTRLKTQLSTIKIDFPNFHSPRKRRAKSSNARLLQGEVVLYFNKIKTGSTWKQTSAFSRGRWTNRVIIPVPVSARP